MSIKNGQPANATTWNNAFASKSDANQLVGIQTLSNSDSGPEVENVQSDINELKEKAALFAETDESLNERVGLLESVQNITSTVDPTASDDDYGVGTIWQNTTDERYFILLSVASEAAVWRKFIDRAGVETLSNKTIRLSKIVLLSAPLADLEQLPRVAGSVYYASGTDEKKLYYDNGTALKEVGTGSGGTLLVVTKTANYTMLPAEDVVLGNGTLTVTLPAASLITKKITIKNIGTGVVTIDGDGSETIDGQLTHEITEQHHSRTLISNGSGWFIV